MAWAGHYELLSRRMTKPTATEAAIFTPLTVGIHGLALLLGMSTSWIEKRVAARDWVTGKILVPIDIAANRRLWLHSTVVRALDDKQAPAERGVSLRCASGSRERWRRPQSAGISEDQRFGRVGSGPGRGGYSWPVAAAASRAARLVTRSRMHVSPSWESGVVSSR